MWGVLRVAALRVGCSGRARACLQRSNSILIAFGSSKSRLANYLPFVTACHHNSSLLLFPPSVYEDKREEDRRCFRKGSRGMLHSGIFIVIDAFHITSRAYSHSSTTIATKAAAYGKCITNHLQDVQKDICSAEFQQFKTCVQKSVSLSLWYFQFARMF
ncbi:hypothetical protein BC936DRAFT_137324 [Jimgerdemannia flammicorona]|uniref:Uncharacterized protein n=1 Tax=Jimgerdemannia flammicorona TaxID=994334 RepID=A0A433CXM5_9FUNG|nr:hypothetical protein BC936DRAFT_137324 [Jimgerdemannia flammicorona]